jgi:hypothetical protein
MNVGYAGEKYVALLRTEQNIRAPLSILNVLQMELLSLGIHLKRQSLFIREHTFQYQDCLTRVNLFHT